jgi:hypothetical protein
MGEERGVQDRGRPRSEKEEGEMNVEWVLRVNNM